MTKISEIATTETDIANVDYIEGERAAGTSVKIPTTLFTQFRGARARMTSDDTTQNITTETAVTFDAVDFDVGSFWSAGAPTKLTIPAGVTYVELTGQAVISLSTSDTICIVSIQHFNSSNVLQHVFGNRFVEHGSTGWTLQASTGPIDVATGDYFVLTVREETDNSVTIGGTGTTETFLALKVLE